MTKLEHILEAKENRVEKKRLLINEGLNVLSISLNIPGVPKSNKDTEKFLKTVQSEFKTFLTAERIGIKISNENFVSDSAGDIYIAGFSTIDRLSVEEVKDCCEKFEGTHSAGRVIDIDIVDLNMNPVSSGKRKACIICGDKPAFDCMRNRTHSFEDLHNKVFSIITDYNKSIFRSKISSKLHEFALKSIFLEISLTPKPGLVDTANSGVHTDMNYFTFLNSTAAIAPYLTQIIDYSFELDDNVDKNEVLAKLRYIGLEAEKSMFAATNGVNTQKGVLFLLGIAIYSAVRTYKELDTFFVYYFRESTMKLCDDLMSDFGSSSGISTHGEKCFNKFGKKMGGGARREAQLGFPTAVMHGLRILIDSDINVDKCSEQELKYSLTRTLLSIMAHNNDTNVLYRSGVEVLQGFQELCTSTLMLYTGKDSELQSLTDYCTKYRISPGGSADLLSVSIFIYLCNQLSI